MAIGTKLSNESIVTSFTTQFKEENVNAFSSKTEQICKAVHRNHLASNHRNARENCTEKTPQNDLRLGEYTVKSVAQPLSTCPRLFISSDLQIAAFKIIAIVLFNVRFL